MPHKPPLIFIYGPTGVGKSDYAVELAQHFPIEILNCDVGQFYTPLSIGTAKPDWQNEVVPHHLFDLLDASRDYTVVEYKKQLLATCQEIWKRGNIPVVVGGSGFYLKSLFFPPHKECEGEDETSESYKHEETSMLWNLLLEKNPERAQAIHPHDRYRIERALALTAMDRPCATILPQYESPDFSYLILCLTRPRENLYSRINERTKKMLQNGWIQEVENLKAEWGPFLKRKKLIGYDVILKALEQQDEDRDALIELIAQKTRHYAKRQMTFWRMLKKSFKPHCTAPNRMQEMTLDDDVKKSFNLCKEAVMTFLQSLEKEDSL